MVDVNRLILINGELGRQLEMVEETHARFLTDVRKLSEELRMMILENDIPVTPVVEDVDYQLVGGGFVCGEELYSSPAGELNIDNDVVPSEKDSPEYTKWLTRAINIARVKFPSARLVTVWNDAGYRVYSDADYTLSSELGMWTYKLLL
jgi:hypothetical protein